MKNRFNMSGLADRQIPPALAIGSVTDTDLAILFMSSVPAY